MIDLLSSFKINGQNGPCWMFGGRVQPLHHRPRLRWSWTDFLLMTTTAMISNWVILYCCRCHQAYRGEQPGGRDGWRRNDPHHLGVHQREGLQSYCYYSVIICTAFYQLVCPLERFITGWIKGAIVWVQRGLCYQNHGGSQRIDRVWTTELTGAVAPNLWIEVEQRMVTQTLSWTTTVRKQSDRTLCTQELAMLPVCSFSTNSSTN